MDTFDNRLYGRFRRFLRHPGSLSTGTRWCVLHFPDNSRCCQVVGTNSVSFSFHPLIHGGIIFVSTTRIPLDKSYVEQKELEKKLEWSTAELGLSVRTTNCLDEQGISTVGDLLACRREDLLQISNFGEKTLEDVYGALEKLGFYRTNRLPQKAKSA